jgi:hypothetical protein
MNKLFKFSIPLLILGLMLTSACAKAGVPSVVPTPTPTPTPAPVPSERASEDKGYPSEAMPDELSVERKIIRTGYITLEIEDIAGTMDKVAQAADELGGYVVSSYKREVESKNYGSVTIRVPADRFGEAFDRLRQLAVKVPSESTEARDVTEEYVDLQARLHNLEATEAQYLVLMEKAETVEEMLKVQQALSDVRGQIEQIEGRIKYLERVSDMALIEVSLEETKKLVEHWSIADAFKSAVRGLTTFWRGIATGLIWIGVFCWIWIPILVIWLRRRRRRGA